VRSLNNVVTVFRRNNVGREEIRQGKGKKVWWNKYIFMRRSEGRLWTKGRVTDYQRKCWTVNTMTVVRLEVLGKVGDIFT
jgi:hypothetical protein